MIRRMEKRDLDRITALEQELFPSDPWQEKNFLYEMKENPYARLFVCEEDGVICGYADLWIMFEQAQIANLAVARDFWGRGIGRKLTAGLLRILSNLGASYATLEVRVSNLRAQNLYKSLGFISVGKRKRYYEDNNEDAYLMVCEHLPEADPDYSEEPWIEKEEES